MMKVCFIGHRKVEETERVKSLIKEVVEVLIQKGATIFLFGSKSAFNDLSLEVVTKLKKKYNYIKRVYVRAEYQYIDKSYEQYLLTYFDETYFPSKIMKAGKSSYVERNYEMIDNSTYCIFYYNENYVPTKRPLKNEKLILPSRNSGTKIAYEYAKRKKKEIINLYH